MKSAARSLLKMFGLEVRRCQTRGMVETSVISLGDHDDRERVLLSYRIEPFLPTADESLLNSHMNYWRSLQMAETFLRLGYAVDVIDFRNLTFVPRKEYSLLIDVRWNLERLSKAVPAECIKVMHIDTAHMLYHNSAECRRLLDLQTRRGVTLSPRRFEMPNRAIEHADCATIAANDFTCSTFRYAGKPIYRLPQSPPFIYPWPAAKDFAACRRNFLWFGSGGFVHKGLDLVLEAFAGLPDYNLTVCGPFYQEKDFIEFYRRELFETPNIEAFGWVDVGSAEFIRIAEQCLGVVSASCSEGGGGSTIACMHAGLIPVVSYETSVDVGDFGVMLSDCSVATIRKAARQLSESPPKDLEARARSCWENVRACHTREKFAEEYEKVIRRILSDSGRSPSLCKDEDRPEPERRAECAGTRS